MRKKSNDKIVINDEKLEISSEYLRALAHPLRMRILAFIDGQVAVNVNKIYNTMQLEQSITSQHLKILREAGIVETERDGKFILYKIGYERLGESINAIRDFVNNLDDSFEDYD